MMHAALTKETEQLFCDFFEKYEQACRLMRNSNQSYQDEFEDLNDVFGFNSDLLDIQCHAYQEWVHMYINELDAYTKSRGFSVRSLDSVRETVGTYATCEFAFTKEELLENCLGDVAKFATTTMQAGHYSFMEFMIRCGTDSFDSRTLSRFKEAFVNGMTYLDEEVLPKAKDFDQMCREIRQKLKGRDSEAWDSCSKFVRDANYQAYKIAYSYYAQLTELDPNDDYAQFLAEDAAFHDFDAFYKRATYDSPSSYGLIGIPIIIENCEKHIRKLEESY